MAAWLKMQKPIGRDRLGVVAGRPHGDEGVGGLLAHHLVDRALAPPTARNAASKLPGDIDVSASSCTRPSFGTAFLISSM